MLVRLLARSPAFHMPHYNINQEMPTRVTECSITFFFRVHNTHQQLLQIELENLMGNFIIIPYKIPIAESYVAISFKSIVNCSAAFLCAFSHSVCCVDCTGFVLCFSVPCARECDLWLLFNFYIKSRISFDH